MELLNLNKTKKQSRELVKLHESLDASSQQSLLDYAQWLTTRSPEAAAEAGEVLVPLEIPRPEEESVVRAIKRLVATFPMVDRSNLFNETSSLMTQHVMQGKQACDAIDELEVLFRSEYEKLSGSA
jgi:hypothetical protein